jgi:ribosome-associated protein
LNARRRSSPSATALRDLVVAALEDLKAVELRVIDVRKNSAVTDFVVIASGTSDRHVKSLAGNVLRKAKEAGAASLGLEGELAGEWVLVDLRDVVVHVMLPRARAFYQLEKLWGVEVPLSATSHRG